MSKNETTVVCLQRKNGVSIVPYDIYIGRACNMGGWHLPESIWKNPYKVSDDTKLTEVEKHKLACESYEKYLRNSPKLLELLPTLVGKKLGCFCKKPKTPNMPCHGDVLVKLIKEMQAIKPVVKA